MPFLTQGKTNWKYIIIVVVLAAIVDGGIFGWIKIKEIPPVEFLEVEKPAKERLKEKINVEELLSLCNKIDEKKDRELCTTVVKGEGEKCQDEECYYGVALKNQDPSLCKKISLEQSRLFCEIYASKDPAKCETLSALIAPSCYFYAALYTRDLKACEKSEEARFLCKAIITKDSSWCEQELTPTNKEICYLQIGATKGDSTLCENVTNPEGKKICQKVAKRDISGWDCTGEEAGLCVLVAILKEDPSICERTSLPGECYKRVISFKLGTSLIFPLVPITPEMF